VASDEGGGRQRAEAVDRGEPRCHRRAGARRARHGVRLKGASIQLTEDFGILGFRFKGFRVCRVHEIQNSESCRAASTRHIPTPTRRRRLPLDMSTSRVLADKAVRPPQAAGAGVAPNKRALPADAAAKAAVADEMNKENPSKAMRRDGAGAAENVATQAIALADARREAETLPADAARQSAPAVPPQPRVKDEAVDEASPSAGEGRAGQILLAAPHHTRTRSS